MAVFKLTSYKYEPEFNTCLAKGCNREVADGTRICHAHRAIIEYGAIVDQENIHTLRRILGHSVANERFPLKRVEICPSSLGRLYFVYTLGGKMVSLAPYLCIKKGSDLRLLNIWSFEIWNDEHVLGDGYMVVNAYPSLEDYFKRGR